MKKISKRKTGAILLVAGTCIGSGMIALPLVLAKLGIALSVSIMLIIWFVMYFTSLINLELNLQAGHGLTLGALGRYFSGKTAESLGVLFLKLLSYSLLAVFIYGGSSIIKELIEFYSAKSFSFNEIATLYTVVLTTLLLLPIKAIDYLNRVLFVGLIAIVAILIIGLMFSIDWTNLPLFSDHYTEVSTWTALLPVVFTSFGFQVIFHTLTNYCEKDAKMLKQAFFWGSLIPAIVYILWTCSVLSAVFQNNPTFYEIMASGNAEIGELIQVLSGISNQQAVQLLVWLVSLLAITTSVLGVGVGLFDAIKVMTAKLIPNTIMHNVTASLLTALPAYIVVILVPNAFITVLGFAGMILAVIAILLPVYLFSTHKIKKHYHYPELNKKLLIYFSVFVGMVVIASELLNLG
jgi:tyrosine-specific transport protein